MRRNQEKTERFAQHLATLSQPHDIQSEIYYQMIKFNKSEVVHEINRHLSRKIPSVRLLFVYSN